MVTNRVMAAGAILSASSAQATAPVAWLKDQLRSKSWRSKLGWNIVAGFNDKLDFSDGTTREATIAVGNYSTPAAKAAAVQAAMNAVSTTCIVTYSPSKFTISRTGTLSLLWQSGANAAASVGKDLGFDVTSDDTGASSYTSDNPAYKSREWVKTNLGSALSVQAGIVVSHNLGAAGTVTLQGNAIDAWSSPTVNQVLSGDDQIRIAFLGSVQTLQWWRLLIDDVSSNVAGYTEVGIWYVGPYVQPSVSYAVGFGLDWEELSEISTTPSGAHTQDERPRRPVWSLLWSEIPEADRSILAAAFALAPKGRCWFLAFNAVTMPTDTAYGFLMQGIGERLTSGLYFDVPVPIFAGALG